MIANSPKTYCLILWFSLCILFTIDTKQFVYISLSQTLLGGFCITGLMIISIMNSIINKRNLLVCRLQLLFLLWGTYMALHTTFIHSSELYKLLYLELTISLVFSIPYMLQYKLLSRSQIENGVLLMSGLQLGYLLLQSMGIIETYNSFFKITGCNENPNVTALLLVGGITIAFDRFGTSRHKILMATILVLSSIFIVILQCRTAYIGFFIIVLVRMAFSDKLKTCLPSTVFKKSLLFGLLTMVLIIGTVGIYSIKKDSADGRLLVWKLSAMMIKENPQGIGIGMFEHDYNLRQGEYFSQGHGTEVEKRLSSNVFMAYNDYLEHGVESGIIGAIFLFSFYLSLIIKSYKDQNIASLSIVIAFSVMSLFNFICATIQPWLVMIVAASCILSHTTANDSVFPKMGSNLIKLSSLLVIIPIGYIQIQMIYAQWKLNRLHDEALKTKIGLCLSTEMLAEQVYTSEAYWTFLSQQYFKEQKYDDALLAISNAMKYSSDASLFFSAFHCYEKMGKTGQGIPYLLRVRDMLPQNLRSRIILLNWYDRNQLADEALSMAYEIVTMPVKIQTKQSLAIQDKAKSYINNKSHDK